MKKTFYPWLVEADFWNIGNLHSLAPLAVGQRAYVNVSGPSCVSQSVGASINFFFNPLPDNKF